MQAKKEKRVFLGIFQQGRTNIISYVRCVSYQKSVNTLLSVSGYGRGIVWSKNRISHSTKQGGITLIIQNFSDIRKDPKISETSIKKQVQYKKKSYDTRWKNIQLFSGMHYTLGRMWQMKKREIRLYLVKINSNDNKIYIFVFHPISW